MNLKECPFCGCEETTMKGIYLYGEPIAYQASCPSCYARGPSNPSEEIAVTYWNAILGRSISVIGDSGSVDAPN